MSESIDFIDRALRQRRSLETVLAALVAKYNRSPNPNVARMIQGIEAEIIQRRRVAALPSVPAAVSSTANPPTL